MSGLVLSNLDLSTCCQDSPQARNAVHAEPLSFAHPSNIFRCGEKIIRSFCYVCKSQAEPDNSGAITALLYDKVDMLARGGIEAHF